MAAPAIDAGGSGPITSLPTASSGNYTSGTFSTTGGNTLIYAWAKWTNDATITSVTDSNGLTWTLRKHLDNTLTGSNKRTIELWAAYSTSSYSGTVTFHTNGGTVTGGTFRVCVFGATGVDATNHFDSHASIPASNFVADNSLSSLGVTYSTTSTNALLICLSGVTGGSITRPAGFTSVMSLGTASMDISYKAVTATQSGVTSTTTFTAAATGFMVMLDAAVDVYVPVSPTVSFTDVTDKRVFELSDGLLTGTVPIVGTYTSTAPTTIEAKITDANGTVLDWTALTSATIAGGNFSGTLPGVPAGGGQDSTVGYTLNVRTKDSGGSVLATGTVGTHYWGMGHIIITGGSSTLEMASTQDTSTIADVRLSMYRFGEGWQACTGAGFIAMGNRLIALNPGVPIGLAEQSQGGSTLLQWTDTGYANYGVWVSAVNALGGRVWCVLWCGGSNDVRVAVDVYVDQATQEANLHTVFTNMRSHLTATTPIFIWATQSAPLEDASRDAKWAGCRAAEMNVGEEAYNYFACSVYDLPIDPLDDVHLSPNATGGSARGGIRAANAISYVFLGVGSYKGPKPPAQTYNVLNRKYNPVTGGVRITIPYVSGTSIGGKTGQSALTGIIFKSAGTPVTPVTAPWVSSRNTVDALLDPGLSALTCEICATHAPNATTNNLFNNG